MNSSKKTSMRKVFSILCVSLAVIICVSYLFQVVIMRSIFMKNTREILFSAHEQTYSNISNYILNVENTALSMSQSPTVLQFLQEKNEVARMHLFKDVQTVFSNISLVDDNFIGFALYDDQGNFITSNATTYRAIIWNSLMPILKQVTISTTVPSNPYIGIKAPYFIVSVPVFEKNSTSSSVVFRGMIVFTLNRNYLQKQLDAGNVYQSGQMSLYDPSDSLIIGKNPPFQVSPDASSDKHFETKTNIIPVARWKLLTVLDRFAWEQESQHLWNIAIVTGMIIALTLISLFLLLSKQIISPIEEISAFMNHLSKKPIIKPQAPFRLKNNQSYQELDAMISSMNLMLS
ncbi:MAG: hypothetical protein GX786_08235, partial [Clostridiales bacterium]|nr:hypothetical protein [Clostridiales bacterium]